MTNAPTKNSRWNDLAGQASRSVKDPSVASGQSHLIGLGETDTHKDFLCVR